MLLLSGFYICYYYIYLYRFGVNRAGLFCKNHALPFISLNLRKFYVV